MPSTTFGNGALLGLLLKDLPQLLPIILQLIGAGQAPKPAIRAAVVAHMHARFDLQTILADLPQIEAAIEAILEAAQGLSGAAPAQENTARYTTHSKGRFGMRVDATTIQTDLTNLATAQQQTATAESGLTDANTALTTAQNGVTTAQTAVSAAQTAVNTAQQNQAALVKQAIADITAVYGAPAA